MSREEIIRMAREAGLLFAPETGAEWSAPIPGADYPLRLAAFAERVSAAEREACAAICDRVALRYGESPELEHFQQGFGEGATICRNRIRARGQE